MSNLKEENNASGKPQQAAVAGGTIENAIEALQLLALHYPGARVDSGDGDYLTEFMVDYDGDEPYVTGVFEVDDDDDDEEDDDAEDVADKPDAQGFSVGTQEPAPGM
jgi:hypothetical protein